MVSAHLCRSQHTLMRDCTRARASWLLQHSKGAELPGHVQGFLPGPYQGLPPAHAGRPPRRAGRRVLSCLGMCRVFSLDPIEGYRPATLAGHRDVLVGVFFARPDPAAAAPRVDLLTVSRDGALFCWAYERGAETLDPVQNPAVSRTAADANGGAAEAGGGGAEAAEGEAVGGWGSRGAKRRRDDGAAAGRPAFAGAWWFNTCRHELRISKAHEPDECDSRGCKQ